MIAENKSRRKKLITIIRQFAVSPELPFFIREYLACWLGEGVVYQFPQYLENYIRWWDCGGSAEFTRSQIIHDLAHALSELTQG